MSTNPKNKDIKNNNISQAEESKILEPEQENKKLQELARLISEKMGLSHFQQEIDVLKETDKVFLTKLEEIIDSVNKTVNAVNALGGSPNVTATNTIKGDPTVTIPQGFDLSKIEVLGNLFDKIMEGYSKYKTATSPANPVNILDQDTVNEYLKKSALGNFELGDAMVQQLKTKVMGKAMTKVVSDIIKHEPE